MSAAAVAERKTTLHSTTRAEMAAAVKVIGARFRQAREMCNLSQSVAAKRLGYANQSKLAKVEGATDTNSVPLWLILRAAKVYEVSTDFLLGASDDWETGARMTQEREVSPWLFDAFNRVSRQQMQVLRRLHDRLEGMQDVMGTMFESAEGAHAALQRFTELNPGFVDMKAGGYLEGAVERSRDAAVSGRRRMERFRLECRVTAQETPQLSLAL